VNVMRFLGTKIFVKRGVVQHADAKIYKLKSREMTIAIIVYMWLFTIQDQDQEFMKQILKQG